MGYKIVNNFLPAAKYGLKAPYSMVPEWLTIHNTANDASARNEAAYMIRNNQPTSYHVAIDDKEAVQIIPFNRTAWHAGDGRGNGNMKSIGIEICYSKSGGERYRKAEANAIEYSAHVLKERGWGIDRLKFHRDWSGKNCPHRILDEGRAQEFKNKVAKRLQELKEGKKTSTSSTEVRKKEVDEMAKQLTPTQQKDAQKLFSHAYRQGVFSTDHSKAVDKMTIGQAAMLTMQYVARSTTK